MKPETEIPLRADFQGEAVSIWTRQSIGIVFNGFLLSFLSATCTGVAYGLFLGCC